MLPVIYSQLEGVVQAWDVDTKKVLFTESDRRTIIRKARKAGISDPSINTALREAKFNPMRII